MSLFCLTVEIARFFQEEIAGTCGNRTHPGRLEPPRNGFEVRGAHQGLIHSHI